MEVATKNKDVSPTIAKKAKPNTSKETSSTLKPPTYLEMIQEAISTLKEYNGSSRHAMLKWVLSNYNLDEKTAKHLRSRFKLSIRQGLENGVLIHGNCK
jgi:histone H1/5